MSTRLLPLLSGFGLLVALVGCDGKPAGAPIATPHPTKGKITFPNGSPLRGGIIYFTPKTIQNGSVIRFEGAGLVDEKGEYAAGLPGTNTGLATGEYTVTIKPRDLGEPAGSTSKNIPKIYRDAATTPLTATVQPTENTFDFVLK